MDFIKNKSGLGSEAKEVYDRQYTKRSHSIAIPIHSPTSTVSPSSPPPPPPRSTSLSAQGTPTPTLRRSPTSFNDGSFIEETTPRRLGRKLPPELTESLIALEEQHQESSTKSDMDSIVSRGSTVTVRLGPVIGQEHASSPKSSPSLPLHRTLSGDEQTIVHHDFAKYTLNVDPPLDQVMVWAKQLATTTPTAVALPPARPTRSIHRHNRQASLTPSDSPSSITVTTFTSDSTSADLHTPTSPRAVPSQFRNNWPSRRNLSPMPSASQLGVASGSRDLPPLPIIQVQRPSVSQSHNEAPSLTTCSTASTSCWSAFEDFEQVRPRGPAGKESRKQKKERKRQEAQAFSEDEPPELRDLFQASLCEVIDECGVRMPFRDLVSGKKTIVIFIRHCKSSSLVKHEKSDRNTALTVIKGTARFVPST